MRLADRAIIKSMQYTTGVKPRDNHARQNDSNGQMSLKHKGRTHYRADGTGVAMKGDKHESLADAGSKLSALLEDDKMAEEVSAYLDGSLTGEPLERFNALLAGNDELAREIEALKCVDSSLKNLGADIISEPVPENLLKIVREWEH